MGGKECHYRSPINIFNTRDILFVDHDFCFSYMIIFKHLDHHGTQGPTPACRMADMLLSPVGSALSHGSSTFVGVADSSRCLRASQHKEKLCSVARGIRTIIYRWLGCCWCLSTFLLLLANGAHVVRETHLEPHVTMASIADGRTYM